MSEHPQGNCTGIPRYFDVWDVNTYDSELRSILDENAELIRHYFIAAEEHELDSKDDVFVRFAPVPHSVEFEEMMDSVRTLMGERAIRAWHYTRMTDKEVELLQNSGIYLSTPETIQARFAAQVAAGAFSQELADRLWADSPFQDEDSEVRSGAFCVVAHPTPIQDSGVKPLLESWGGESAYFRQTDPAIRELLRDIGRPRVLEVVVPLSDSRFGARSAADTVAATYARELGCLPDPKLFEIHTRKPLGPEHILAVHSEGDTAFSSLGRGYPAHYIEVDFEAEWEARN